MSEKNEGLVWDIMLGVAGGIVLGTLVLAVLAAFIQMAYTHGLRLDLANLQLQEKQQVNDIVNLPTYTTPESPAPVTNNPAESAPVQPPVQHWVTVGAKSIEECNALTNGELNEQWKRCRQPHQELVNGPQ